MTTTAHNFSAAVDAGAFTVPVTHEPYVTDPSAALLALAQGNAKAAKALVATREIRDYSQAVMTAEPVAAIHALVAAGNSIRRATAVVSEMGATLPEVQADSDVHFYAADAPADTIARCGASLDERITRHGHKVTCETCKDLHRAELTDNADELESDELESLAV